MERTRDEEDRPLEPRDWEETRGEEQQEAPTEQQEEAPTEQQEAPTQQQEEAPTEQQEAPAEAAPASTGEMTHERGSQAEAQEYQWHTGTKREHGADDAVEF